MTDTGTNHTMTGITLRSSGTQLDLDERGCIAQLTNLVSGSTMRSDHDAAQNWKLVVLTDHYPVVNIWGSEQAPSRVEHDAATARVVYHYESVTSGGAQYPVRGGDELQIGVQFAVWLDGDAAKFSITLDNRHDFRIREVWCPMLSSFAGWSDRGIENCIDMTSSNWQHPDVMHHPLPAQEYIFNVDVFRETSHFKYPRQLKSQWIDFGVTAEGLMATSEDTSLTTTSFRVEKAPPRWGDFSGQHHLPEGVPHYINLSIQKLTAIDPGESWTSADAVLWPHTGDWHASADRYADWANSVFAWADSPAWIKETFTGFQHLLGKTHLDEIYFPFDRFADTWEKTYAKDGINILMTYGHEEHGAESADFHIQPASDLGGAEGFRAMADRVHTAGGKVAIMTHRHASLATDDPAAPRFEGWYVVDREGHPRQELWPKTTLESFSESMLRTFEATGPIWQRVCVFCDEWWETYVDELKQLIDLGLDGVQMDLMVDEGPICYGVGHGHKPGAPEEQLRKLGERLAALRAEIKSLHPDFAFMGEEYSDWLYQYLDISFSRYHTTMGARTFTYTFPAFCETVSVGYWAYDQVAKGMITGKGFGIEVFLIKDSILAQPEFHDYVALSNQLRLRLRDQLLDSTFRDRIGVDVDGDVEWGVHESDAGTALVVANFTDDPQPFRLHGHVPNRLSAHRPGEGDVEVFGPASHVLAAHRYIVLTGLASNGRAAPGADRPRRQD